jgi:hypothetical protein
MKMDGLFPAVLKKLYLVSTEVLFSFAGVVIARLLCPALGPSDNEAQLKGGHKT